MSMVGDLASFIAELQSAPWYRKVWWATRYRAKAVIRSPRMARLSLTCAWQRLTRGWDDRAVWDLKAHLTTTLGAQLTEMASIAHGWPDPYPGGFEGWVADLGKHGAALSAYGAFDDLACEPADRPGLRADAEMALHWVADNLGALWD